MARVKLVKPGDIRVYREQSRSRAKQRARALARIHSAEWGEIYPETFVVDATDSYPISDINRDHRERRP